MSSTPKSLLLIKTTLFDNDIHGKGNVLMDNVLAARASNTPILNQATEPLRFMLKKDDKGDYFVTGKGTASTRVRLNGQYSVTYMNLDNQEGKKESKKRKDEIPSSSHMHKKMRM